MIRQRLDRGRDLLLTGNLDIELLNRRRAVRRLYRRPTRLRQNWSARRINRVAQLAPNYKRYLEIGLSSGRTFEQVRMPERLGIDPKPLFDVAKLPDGAQVQVITSDDYFSCCNDHFDFVFVDGLHQYRQAYRDIISSVNHCLEGAVLVDDVIPSDHVSAHPDMDESLRRRQEMGLPGRPWHGDVFRAVLCITEHHPELALRTIVAGGNPQSVVWSRGGQKCTPVADEILDQYENCGYSDVFSSGVPPEFGTGAEDDILREVVERRCE